MKKEIKIVLGLGAFLALASAGGLFLYQSKFGPPVISVKNSTNAALHDIRVFDARWEHRIERLEPGAETNFVQHASGESGLSVSFIADGKTHERKDLSYFEETGGYCVEIEVLADDSVRTESRIDCFRRRR